MKNYYEIRTSVNVIIIDSQNKILLMKRKGTGFYDGEWCLPGGHLDPNESLINGAKRESFEEINFNPLILKFVHVSHRKATIPDIQDYIDTYYKVIAFHDNDKNEIYNKELNKCEKIEWFDINNLPKNIMHYEATTLELIKSNIQYSEIGWE